MRLSLGFVDGRHHLRGADLLTALHTVWPDMQAIDIRFHHPIEGDVELVKASDYVGDSPCTIIVKLNGENVKFKVRPLPRQNFEALTLDEAAIVARATHSENALTIEPADHDNFYDLVFTLQKALVNTAFPAVNGKWMLTRYLAEYPHPANQPMTVSLHRNLGTRLVCSNVSTDKQAIGQIFFSLMESA
ncbi:MAG: hypothetical protein HWE20_11535 [Gammaproteobacteria bacterium]|nr:hypothetical protein [Gammaproteobacteria bacterium]